MNKPNYTCILFLFLFSSSIKAQNDYLFSDLFGSELDWSAIRLEGGTNFSYMSFVRDIDDMVQVNPEKKRSASLRPGFTFGMSITRSTPIESMKLFISSGIYYERSLIRERGYETQNNYSYINNEILMRVNKITIPFRIGFPYNEYNVSQFHIGVRFAYVCGSKSTHRMYKNKLFQFPEEIYKINQIDKRIIPQIEIRHTTTIDYSAVEFFIEFSYSLRKFNWLQQLNERHSNLMQLQTGLSIRLY